MSIVRRLGGPRVFRELRQELASGVLYLVVFVGILVLDVCGLFELWIRGGRAKGEHHHDQLEPLETARST